MRCFIKKISLAKANNSTNEEVKFPTSSAIEGQRGRVAVTGFSLSGLSPRLTTEYGNKGVSLYSIKGK